MAVVSLTLFTAGCAGSSITIPMHDPIYPAQDEAVTYTLERASGPKIIKVELYESVAGIDTAGTVTSARAESLLQAWSSPGGSVTFTARQGYPQSSLVRYRYVVRTRSGLWPFTKKYSQSVTFATQPYPVLALPDPLQGLSASARITPAPVYAVGDPACTFDIVLIPDRDIVSDLPDQVLTPDRLEAFRGYCRRMIREAVKDEPTTRVFRRAFNFYINPLPGSAAAYRAGSEGCEHRLPANHCSFSSYEVRVLMHRTDLQDCKSEAGGPCDARGTASTETGNLGTFLHEFGHGCFDLADEYSSGNPEPPNPFPNTWDSERKAREAARSRGRAPSEARRIGSTRWWKVCGDGCQMSNAGSLRAEFDRPCRDRILWCVMEVAASGAR